MTEIGLELEEMSILCFHNQDLRIHCTRVAVVAALRPHDISGCASNPPESLSAILMSRALQK